MSILKRIDRKNGIALRWLADLVTGNYFKRIEQRMASIEIMMKSGRSSGRATNAIVKVLFDQNQETILKNFEARNDKE